MFKIIIMATKETIIQRLLKIQKLANEGYKGESEAAKKLLEKQLAKHGLSMDDLIQEDTREYTIPYSQLWERKILRQVAASMELNSYGVRKKKVLKQLGFKVTAIVYAELLNKYEFHKQNYERELDVLLTAYVQKHKLYREFNDNKECLLSREELFRISQIMEGLSSDRYERRTLKIESSKK